MNLDTGSPMLPFLGNTQITERKKKASSGPRRLAEIADQIIKGFVSRHVRPYHKLESEVWVAVSADRRKQIAMTAQRLAQQLKNLTSLWRKGEHITKKEKILRHIPSVCLEPDTG